jgi:iron(III) transport system substrate-binding protein
MKKLIRQLARIAIAALLLGSSVPALAGEITVYTALDTDDVKIYIEAFEKQVPDVKVNIYRVSAGKLGAKIRAEAQNPRQDVIWGWTISEMERPDITAMIEPYRPKGVEKINPKFVDPNGNWFATTGYMAALCVNTDMLKEKNLPMPESWQDLIKPVYKGQIVMPSPLDSGTGYLQVAAFLQTMGEKKGWEYLKQLDANIAQYTSSGSKPGKMAQDKEYAIGITYDFAVVKIVNTFVSAGVPVPVKLVIPKEGSGYELEVTALMKTSTNKADAKKFLDWLMSDQAVALYDQLAAMNCITGTSRSKAAKQANLPSDMTKVLAPVDLKKSARDKEAILAKWKTDIYDKRPTQ